MNEQVTRENLYEALDGVKKDFRKEIKDLSDNMPENFKTEIQTQISAANSNPFGSTAGIISVAAVVLALIAAIIAFFFKNKISDNMNRIIKNSNSQGEKIKELSEQISKLETEIAILKNDNQNQRQLLEKNNAVNSNISPATKIISAVPNVSSFPSAATNPPPRPVVEKWSDFVQEFNSLANQSGYDAKRAHEEFLNKYNVQAFSCVNFEARMNTSSLAPQFGAATSLQNADYWAYEFETGTFAVVPRAKTYTDNHHAARAMGEVFESNFVQGGTYNKIRVERPAIFKGMWNLDKPGKLELK